jgi:hypothetical protein
MLMLDKPHRFSQNRSAHAVALEQLGLGTEHFTDRPPQSDDVVHHLDGHSLGQLRLRVRDPADRG